MSDALKVRRGYMHNLNYAQTGYEDTVEDALDVCILCYNVLGYGHGSRIQWPRSSVSVCVPLPHSLSSYRHLLRDLPSSPRKGKSIRSE